VGRAQGGGYTAHLDISNETLAAIPTGNFGVLPG
jgi:hypothetical protein